MKIDKRCVDCVHSMYCIVCFSCKLLCIRGLDITPIDDENKICKDFKEREKWNIKYENQNG
jgi:hypothetical protein